MVNRHPGTLTLSCGGSLKPMETSRPSPVSPVPGFSRRIRDSRRPAWGPLQSRRPILAVRIAPTVQHAAFDLELLVQGAHALPVDDPLRHALLELLGKDTVFARQLRLLSIQ